MVHTTCSSLVLRDYVQMLVTPTEETKLPKIIIFVKNVLLFYHRHSELFVKYNVGLKKKLALLQQGISEPVIKFVNSKNQ